MLVVISDLHFEEVGSDAIPGAPAPEPRDWRNFQPRAFDLVFAEIASAAASKGAGRVDLVLAGDVFDLHRTALWLEDDLRPYVACADVAPGSPLEARVLAILDAIAAEPHVAGSLAALRALEGGTLGGAPTRLHYLPGNHDRLVDATPATRARVRALLGLGDATEPFDHHFACDDPRVLVRHGHEYDPHNFAGRLGRHDDVPATFPAHLYGDWTFGDFVTVEIAMGLPHAFRRVHGDPAIAASPLLSTVYRRLLEFDDVRPQSQLVSFLLSIPEQDPRVVWRALEPAVQHLLDRLADDPRTDLALARAPVSPGWRLLLDSRLWRAGAPLWLVRALGSLAARAEVADPVAGARRERVVREGTAAFVVAGHTHNPQVAFLASPEGFERYYVDTGTWRNAVLGNGAGGFGRLKAITYVTVYASTEDAGSAAGAGKSDKKKVESFDFWSGFSQRW